MVMINCYSMKIIPDVMNFRMVSGSVDKEKIYELRRDVYEENKLFHLLSTDKEISRQAGDNVDDIAYHFILEVKGRVLASCRVVDINQHEEFSNQLSLMGLKLCYEAAVVIERLVLHKSIRGSLAYKTLLANTCGWMDRQTASLFWYAKCNPSLVKIYRKFSANVIGTNNITLDKNKSLDYVYLKGNIKETLAASTKYLLVKQGVCNDF